jgi:CHAT domain-containing protein
LGLLAGDRGELDRAQEYYLPALKIEEQLAPQSVLLAITLSNLAVLERERGELGNADSYSLRALKIYEQLDHPVSLMAAACLNTLGTVARLRGELDRARDYHLLALTIQEKLAPQGLRVASSLNSLGAVARLRGELGRARDYHLQALRISERLAPHSLFVSRSLDRLGDIALDRGELNRAIEYYLQALRIEQELVPQSVTLANTLRRLGNVVRLRGDFERAQAYYLQALRLYEHLAPQSFEMATNLKSLGKVARDRGFLDHALGYYKQALETLEQQVSKLGGSYDVEGGFRARNGDFYHDMLNLLLAEGRFDEAFHVLERFHAQTFLTMLAERDIAFTTDIPEELDRERRRITIQYDRTLKKMAGLNPRDHGKEIEANRRELQKLNEEAGVVEASIRKASPRLAALKYPRPLDAAEAGQALDSGTLLLSYSVGKGETAVFALSRSGDLEVKILPFGEETLRSKVKQLRSLIREAAQESSLGALRQRQVEAVSRELYTALLKPVAERIAKSERLLILPDGPLHALPFAALIRDGADEESDGQYLAEWKPLHVALSATVFAELKQRRRPASESNAPQAPVQLAAFGDPVYPQSLVKVKGDSSAALPTIAGVIAQVDVSRGDPIVRSAVERGIFDWQPLLYTRHEVEGIARLFSAGTARTFLGPEALEERIKSLDPKIRILHLAAHGYTDEQLPSSSFIALTIPEDTNPDATPERDNGLLQVWEIFERVRLDADLVVLSACDSGLGEEQGGEGLIGLTRAFQYAGARTVMASLWSVEDRATSELMIRFYKHLRAGLSKDEALRQAQIELIRGPIEVVDENGGKTLLDASAPYYWAGFQLYGDWR